ncbi:MAG: hypothetical protein Crog4KO_05350 [Crocinitomicaceae bacterium]
MKTITAFALFVFIAGSVSAQEQSHRLKNRPLKVTTSVSTTQSNTTQATPKVQTATGTVRDASCGAYIEVDVNGELKRYFPVNLNSKNRIEGYTIKFEYVDDAGAFPEGCEITKSIRVNNLQYISLD